MLFTKVRDVKTPSRGTDEAAGLDLYIPNDVKPFMLGPNESINIPSGIKVRLPPNMVGIILNKSGIGIKGVLVGAQVIDSDYRGEIHINIHNVSKLDVSFQGGQKAVQMLLMPVALDIPVEETQDSYNQHSETKRGEGGFGSTGLG